MYRVEYAADAWKPSAPEHRGAGMWQVVTHELTDGCRLYVELARYPGQTAEPDVRLACIEAPWTDRWGARRWRRVQLLREDNLKLVENRPAGRRVAEAISQP
jgi:hypothetical protein